MDYLAEIIFSKKILESKIEELKDILNNEQSDTMAERLVKLLEEHQSTLIEIHRANIASKLNIGGVEVDVATAVILKKSIEHKINCLTMLIINPECSLDKLELMEQRDIYYKDFKLISIGINRNDLNVTIE